MRSRITFIAPINLTPEVLTRSINLIIEKVDALDTTISKVEVIPKINSKSTNPEIKQLADTLDSIIEALSKG